MVELKAETLFDNLARMWYKKQRWRRDEFSVSPIMKKTISKEKQNEETRPEYDFSDGVRGKYARTLKENGYTIRIYHDDGTFSERSVLGVKTVVLDEDVWEYFPTSDAVNQALRTLIKIFPQKVSSDLSMSKTS